MFIALLYATHRFVLYASAPFHFFVVILDTLQFFAALWRMF